ncbi:MAG: signal peptidase I [Acidimicrobiia bacterium]
MTKQASGRHLVESTEEETVAPEERRSFLAELPGLLLTALAIAVVIKTFLIQPFWIPSESMVPTIQVNDRVMVNKLAYRFGEPQRGDIVVFTDPAAPDIEESIPEAVIRSVLEAIGVRTRGRDDLIKRVIGLPGETVEIKESQVWINGEPLEEPYIDHPFMPDDGPYTLGSGEIFVMGDNREFSFDSRRFGPIPLAHVIGKAFVIMWPPDRFGSL